MPTVRGAEATLDCILSKYQTARAQRRTPELNRGPRNRSIICRTSQIQTNIQHIAQALVVAECTSLDKQAKALGIHRATAWTIIRTKHKRDRLNTNITNRMLPNPELPPRERAVIHTSPNGRSLAADERCRRLRSASTGTANL